VLVVLAVNSSIRLAASYQPGRAVVVPVVQSLPATSTTPALLVGQPDCLPVARFRPQVIRPPQHQVWVVPVVVVEPPVVLAAVVVVYPAVVLVAAPVR